MFKNLKSLFIVPEEEQLNKNETAQPIVQPKNVSSETIQSTTPPPQAQPKGRIDNTILDRLFEALEENNQPGFDYLEFRKAIQTLNALPMDEATKYQSTYATASTMGVTLNKLLDSIEFYKKVLASQEEIFTKAIKEQTAVNINNKVVEKDKLNAAIAEKNEQIKKLVEDIQTHQSEILQITSSIDAAEMKIKETSMNFETSLNIIKDQLDQDYSKLNQYIK